MTSGRRPKLTDQDLELVRALVADRNEKIAEARRLRAQADALMAEARRLSNAEIGKKFDVSARYVERAWNEGRQV